MSELFIVKDWADNHLFKDKIFNSFEDGWYFLHEEIPKLYSNSSEKELDEIFGEYYILPK